MRYNGYRITTYYMNEMPLKVSNEMLYQAFMDFKVNVENRLDRIEKRLDRLEDRMHYIESEIREIRKNESRVQIAFSRKVLFGTGFLSAIVAFITAIFTGTYIIEN